MAVNFPIITTEPNKLSAEVQVSVILHKRDDARWPDRGKSDGRRSTCSGLLRRRCIQSGDLCRMVGNPCDNGPQMLDSA